MAYQIIFADYHASYKVTNDLGRLARKNPEVFRLALAALFRYNP